MSVGKYQRRKDNRQNQFNGAAANQNYKKPAEVTFEGLTEARLAKQQEQARVIKENDISFCVGPAGTGKTYGAMVAAVAALKSGEVDTILLARPAVEAGETIGFLPGGQNEKMAPYMRPLYDELDKQYGRGAYRDMIRDEQENPDGEVEVAPVGTMRGRTFTRAFVILDEAQNLKREELKMALTRLGPGSKMVITGDPGQIDLNPPELSGLEEFIEKLEGLEGVGVHRYGPEDVMRHPTVERVVNRLEGKGQLNQPPKSQPKP